MKPSETLLRAAEAIADEYYAGCCGSIRHVAGAYSDDEIHARRYLDLFAPNKAIKSSFIDHGFFWFGPRQTKNQNVRILALLFAHQIAKSERN